MAYSTVETVALGDTNTFAVPFPYLKRPDVHVYVDEAEMRPLTWLTPNLVRLPVAAGDLLGKTVRVQRITPRQTAAVTFKPGGLDQGDLNVAVLQLLYVSQEAADRVDALPTALPSNRYDFKGHRAVNVKDPVFPQDAATASWVNSRVVTLWGQLALDEMFATDSIRFRALFAGFLLSLPAELPDENAVPWLNGGLLAITSGELDVTTPEQLAFNARFGPLFTAYLQTLSTVPPTDSNVVWVNGGLVALS